MNSKQIRNRGAALVAVIVTALITSIIAFGALLLAMSHAQTSDVQVDRLRAHYAAEAGLVLAQQKLWANPGYCGEFWSLDTDGVGGVDPTNVSITVTNCGAGNSHRIQAKVIYQ